MRTTAAVMPQWCFNLFEVKFQCGCAVSHTAEMAHLKAMSVLVLVADVGVFSFFLSTRFTCLGPHCSILIFSPVR